MQNSPTPEEPQRAKPDPEEIEAKSRQRAEAEQNKKFHRKNTTEVKKT